MIVFFYLFIKWSYESLSPDMPIILIPTQQTFVLKIKVGTHTKNAEIAAIYFFKKPPKSHNETTTKRQFKIFENKVSKTIS